jgi:hypothetical protein
MSQTIAKNALADFPESSRAYVNGQIAKLKSGRYNADDCLWRIASCADLPVHSCYTQMTPGDRVLVRQFISEFLGK